MAVAPTSSMILSNNGVTDVWAAGIQIPAGENYTFGASAIAAVCADIHFWAAFLGGIVSVNLNGQGLPATTPAVVAFLIAVAIGDIVP